MTSAREKRNPPCHLHFADDDLMLHTLSTVFVASLWLSSSISGSNWRRIVGRVEISGSKKTSNLWCQIIFRILSYKIFFIPRSPGLLQQNILCNENLGKSAVKNNNKLIEYSYIFSLQKLNSSMVWLRTAILSSWKALIKSAFFFYHESSIRERYRLVGGKILVGTYIY